MKGYDEPEILRSQLSQFGPITADAGQVALQQGVIRHEFVYDEQIFECDSGDQPRFLVLLDKACLPTMSVLMMEATQILLNAAFEPGIFEGLIWVPLRIDRHRPSFFTAAPQLDSDPVGPHAFQRRLADSPDRRMFSGEVGRDLHGWRAKMICERETLHTRLPGCRRSPFIWFSIVAERTETPSRIFLKPIRRLIQRSIFSIPGATAFAGGEHE